MKPRRDRKSEVALERKREMQKKKAGEFEDTSDQDEDTLDAKVNKPRKKLVKLSNAFPERAAYKWKELNWKNLY